MAVQERLTSWNLTRLSDQFKDMSLTRFLGISRKTAVQQYGNEFASRHQRLCDELRSTLYSKRLTDQQDATPVNYVKSCSAEECLLALTSGIETMCVSRNEKSDIGSTASGVRVSPRMSRTPIASRLGPLQMAHVSIKTRLGSKKRHRNQRRFIHHRDRIDVRRNLSAAFQAENEYYTPRANRRYAFTVPRAPVKERLGTTLSRRRLDF